MYPASIFPASIFPGPAFPGAGKAAAAGGSSGVLFPGPIFPAAAFPPALFPGSARAAGGSSGTIFPGSVFPPALFPPSLFPGSSAPKPAVYTAFKPALVAYLRASAALAAILGVDANGDPSIAAGHPAQSDGLPSLSYRVTDREPGLDFDDDAGFADATVELVARATDPGDVDEVIAALWRLFHSKGPYAMSGVAVMVSTVGADADDYDPGDDSTDDGTFSDSASVTFRYRTR